MVWILVGGCSCATSWCDLDLIFHLAVLTLSLKVLSLRCRKLLCGRIIGGGVDMYNIKV